MKRKKLGKKQQDRAGRSISSKLSAYGSEQPVDKKKAKGSPSCPSGEKAYSQESGNTNDSEKFFKRDRKNQAGKHEPTKAK